MTDDPRLPVSPGQIVGGKYRVEEIIAQGGMGVVCLARHIELEQPVAMKFMRPEFLERPDCLQRFLDEARAAAALSSPHVIKMLDVGRLNDSVPFIVMERLEGARFADHPRRVGRAAPLRRRPVRSGRLRRPRGGARRRHHSQRHQAREHLRRGLQRWSAHREARGLRSRQVAAPSRFGSQDHSLGGIARLALVHVSGASESTGVHRCQNRYLGARSRSLRAPGRFPPIHRRGSSGNMPPGAARPGAATGAVSRWTTGRARGRRPAVPAEGP